MMHSWLRSGNPGASQVITTYPEDIHEHLMEVLRDLDAVVTEFSSLIAESTSATSPGAVDDALTA
jgi:hypothetical protein